MRTGLRRGRRCLTILVAALAGVTAMQPAIVGTATAGETEVLLQGPLRYQVFAGDARRNRKLMGPVTNTVQRVPAEPVDSFVWDGVGSDPVLGELVLEVDPVRNTGFVVARWTDEYGTWILTQTRFIHPHHASGVRLGASMGEIARLLNQGIAHNVYLHGDTGAGFPVLPTVFAYLAAWGPVDVTLNGVPFENPFGLPGPQWLGHLMLTEGVRGPDGTVRNRSGEIYRPERDAQNGAVDPADLELHLVFHDERFPRTASLPDLYSFTYHLVFEDVVFQVVQAERPIRLPDELLSSPGPGNRTAR